MGGEILETVTSLLATELNSSESRIREARSLRRELKMDSVAAVNLLFALEEKYDIELNLESADDIDTASDIAAFVAKVLASRQ
jgi:acyl carrier protein